MNVKRFSALVDAFYAAAVEPGKWPDVAVKMAATFASDSMAIQVREGDFSNITLRVTTANYSPAAQQQYVAYFHKLDPFANGWRATGTSGIFAGHELVDPEEFRRSEIYTDYCCPLGIFHTLGAGVDVGPDTQLLVGIHRPIEQEDFTAADRRRLELSLPHLSRAAQAHTLLATANLQRRMAYEIFASLAVAAIVVNASGRVVYANHVADRLLALGDGLRKYRGQLATLETKEEASLLKAIASASRIAGGGVAPVSDVLTVRRIGKLPLSVLVIPFRRDSWIDGSADALAIVFATDPEARQPPAISALTALYQLTPAEARLLKALLQGTRIADYAAQLGISANTANAQLKQIFVKTQTNRQVDLMRQVLSDSVISLAGHKSLHC
jgi:DNA-binding CsgD family transcriptional regulator